MNIDDKGLEFYILDTETSGLRENYHEITEIAVIRYSSRVQIFRQIKAEHPENASLQALQVTNKTKADLANGISKQQAVEDINAYFDKDGKSPRHRCIVAHNAPFDRRFLHALWKDMGSHFPCDLWLDTLTLMREYRTNNGLPKKTSIKLGDSCDLLGCKKIAENIHSATVDTRNNYFLFKELMEGLKVDYVPFILNAQHRLPEDIDDDFKELMDEDESSDDDDGDD